MIYRRVKQVLASLALAVLFLSSGLRGNSVASAANGHLGQDRDERWEKRPNRAEQRRFRREEQEELRRVREMDCYHRLRYQTNNRVRTVGYYDQFGNYHEYGFYDRWGILSPLLSAFRMN